jgi:5'-nucleotidase
MGRELYWFTVAPIEGPGEGTDLWAVARNLVSLTPLRLDLTDHEALEAVARTAPSSAVGAGPGC